MLTSPLGSEKGWNLTAPSRTNNNDYVCLTVRLTGIVTENVLPRPGAESTVRQPPSSSASRREIGSPSPVPPGVVPGNCTNSTARPAAAP